ncbi:MAG TPA: SRPBCC family protein [Capillimicrobium sp.]|nr:SRPBCC family protein [Capillimicrobium sp.]
MDPVTVSTTIGRPREEVFAYLADIANHPEFTDHYLVDWRLTRENSVGRGAGARFTFKAPLNRYNQADVTFIEVEAPRRIVEAGRGGKFNRTRLRSVYELEPASGGQTRVTYTLETRPGNLADRIMESLGFRGWVKRKSSKALRRLRSILEDGESRGQRITVGGR